MTESDDDLEIRKDDNEIKKALVVTTFERLWIQRNSFTLIYSKTAQHTANFLTSAVRVLGVTLLIIRLSLIARVNVVLNTTVVVDSDKLNLLK